MNFILAISMNYVVSPRKGKQDNTQIIYMPGEVVISNGESTRVRIRR